MGEPESPNDIVGHKTFADGHHEPLRREEADAIWKSVEQKREKRAVDMPSAKEALSTMLDAKQRMQELGWWQGLGLRVRRGDECAVAEFGSTGIWRGWVDQEGKYVHYCDCVSDPRKTWLKPLADLTPDEREHMEQCDKREAEAYRAMLDSFAAMDGDRP